MLLQLLMLAKVPVLNMILDINGTQIGKRQVQVALRK